MEWKDNNARPSETSSYLVYAIDEDYDRRCLEYKLEPVGEIFSVGEYDKEANKWNVLGLTGYAEVLKYLEPKLTVEWFNIELRKFLRQGGK